jgi:glycogen phosphorylase
MNPRFCLPRPLPDSLKDLAELALDLRWCWNHATDPLWQAIDPEMWEASGNPWLMLTNIPQRRIAELAADRRFCSELIDQVKARQRYLNRPAWFGCKHSQSVLKNVAFFSMEFGLSEALPLCSGGLGILAGDHLKAASDLGVPVVGIGLLYRRGYFHQAVDASGNQLDRQPANEPSMLPILPLRDAGGEWLRVVVELPSRPVTLRVWEARAGRVRLYLLDSNDPENLAGDRGITEELYGGDIENRLRQEIVLGIGGWRLLRALKQEDSVCHLNEAHAAFSVLERARLCMNAWDQPFASSLCCTRAGNIFTTHTPKAAGFECFPAELISQYFPGYAAELGLSMTELLALGRSTSEDTREPFNMAYLAVRGCNRIIAVSRNQQAASRHLMEPLFPRWPLQEVPVECITGGVHTPSWESAAAEDLWTIACGKGRWHGQSEAAEEDLSQISDEALWAFRNLGRKTMIDSLRGRSMRLRAAPGRDPSEQLAFELDPNVLTLAVAGQFMGYKRPDLLIRDPERLARMLTNPERPVQIIVAGKANPLDREGQRMVRQWALFMRRRDVQGRAVFIEDFDLALARELAQGVDLWIHMPRRSWEASGAGGMKVLGNGGLNLSVLDGWWAEAYAPEVGWALGSSRQFKDDHEQDMAEAAEVLNILEEEVIPAFYARNQLGLPTEWISRMRNSMARLTPRYSAGRMLREYAENLYLPSAEAYGRRAANKGATGAQLCTWQLDINRGWSGMVFGSLTIEPSDNESVFRVQVNLGAMNPGMIRVELYADPSAASPMVRQEMSRGHRLPGTTNAYEYSATLPADRPIGDYTPRIVPCHPEAIIPIEESHSLWQR